MIFICIFLFIVANNIVCSFYCFLIRSIRYTTIIFLSNGFFCLEANCVHRLNKLNFWRCFFGRASIRIFNRSTNSFVQNCICIHRIWHLSFKLKISKVDHKSVSTLWSALMDFLYGCIIRRRDRRFVTCCKNQYQNMLHENTKIFSHCGH